jgi:DNA polymerase-3 subunit delta
MAEKKQASPRLSFDDLRKLRDPADLAPCYLLCGDEDYLKENALEQLKKLTLAGGDETFNYHRLDGPNVDLDALTEAVEAFPSFAEKSFVEVRDFDLYKVKEDDGSAQKLLRLLSDLPDTCCLVFYYATIPFSEDKRKKKLHGAISAAVQVAEINKQSQGALLRWIDRRFAAHGQSISRENAEYLLLLCGELMTGLISELEKISAYAKGREITRADIDAVAVPVAEAQVFKLSDAIAGKRFDEAASLMATLLQMNEHPLMILGLIGSQCRRLYLAKLLAGQGVKEAKLMSVFGFRSEYPAKLLLGNARRFSLHWCEEAVLACGEADYLMKNSSADPEDLLRSLFLKLAGER